MSVYQIRKPEGIDSLALREAPIPHPDRGQAVVRMRAASLPDLIPPSDGAGEVAEIGTEVTRVKPSDRVAGTFMQIWIGGDIEPVRAASSLGATIHGVLADYVLFDQQRLVHLPAHLSFEEGATLSCAGVTTWNALNAGTPLTDGQGVDHVVEVGGFGALPRSIEAARFTAQIHQISVLTGAGGRADASISMRKDLILRGIYVGSRQMSEAMNRTIAVNALRPVIDRMFAFEQAPEAYRHSKANRIWARSS
jgi:NADPH:quinone reductase-like Zn-dependent oxidoreductase